MRRSTTFWVATILITLLQACGGGRRAVTPQQTPVAEAFSYNPINSLPVNFEINDIAQAQIDSTSIKADGNKWFNIIYPTLGNATVYCTISEATDSDALDHILGNRLERMSLNAAGRPGEKTTFTTETGYNNMILVIPAGSITPVQFISYTDDKVISGALFMEQPVDSITRIVKADMIHALGNLR